MLGDSPQNKYLDQDGKGWDPNQMV